MCGIFGYIGKNPNGSKLVLEGLKSLEYRGYDSWGVAAVPLVQQNTKSRIAIKKRIGKIGLAHVDELPTSSFAFGHTRWATHGGVTEINAHPHLDCTGRFALIHNGIIENYQEIKKRLIKKGHKFISDTDTEVAVHLIEENVKTTLFSKAVQKAFNEMTGLNAFIVMDARENKFVAVRNGSPLVVGFGDGENFLASDAPAILPYTKQVHYLDDDEMALIGTGGVLIFNARTGEHIRPKKQLLTWDIQQVEKGDFPDYMLKEIHEQPGIIIDIATNSLSHANNLAQKIRIAKGTYLLGCGSAMHASMIGAYLFDQIASRHANWVIGSEFAYSQKTISPQSLIIALSQSGETMDTLESVKIAKQKGAKIFAFVNVLGSALYRKADYKTLIGAGPEKSVASTKAFTGKLAHLLLQAYALAGKPKIGQQLLYQTAKSIKKVFEPENIKKIKKLAKILRNTQHIFVIGRSLSYPIALETALKIKEISYIHAEGIAAGELKHGMLALVQKGTPVVALLPKDDTYADSLAGAMEMKARGAYIIGVSSHPHEIFDYYLPVADTAHATIITNAIVGQLLAYYLTIEKGLDPDKPRNLAKSVTVK